MAAFHKFALRLAVIALIAVQGIAADAQISPPTNRSGSMVLNFRLDKDRLPVGQSPVAILIVDNLTDGYLKINDGGYRIHVDWKGGEAPTSMWQRCRKGAPHPGDTCPPVTITLNVDVAGPWLIFSGMSDFRKIQLGYLYDLSAPGVYSVYAEVLDSSSQRWLRTQTIQFEIQAPIA
jgi:hypothetical protein